MFFVYFLLYLTLFATSYFLMKYRQHLRELSYGAYDWDPAIIVSVFIPPIGIVFALVEIALVKLNIND